MHRSLAIVLCLLLMQSIAKDPYLIQTYPDGELPKNEEAVVYTKYCPFDRQLLSCWLLNEYSRQDSNPDYTDAAGYRHWHDITQLKQEWLCECGHRWQQEWNNGDCWCGWKPW